MNEIKYQVKMTYQREDIGALVRTMEFRRHPEKNIRLARKIGYPIFGIAIMAAGVSRRPSSSRCCASWGGSSFSAGPTPGAWSAAPGRSTPTRGLR